LDLISALPRLLSITDTSREQTLFGRGKGVAMDCKFCNTDMGAPLFIGTYEGGVWQCDNCGAVCVDNGPPFIDWYQITEAMIDCRIQQLKEEVS
jgi:ribosomal protein L37AE/L43A